VGRRFDVLSTPAASNAPLLAPQPPVPSASVVVIADVGHLLRHPATLAEVRPAFAALARCETHVVLCSEHGPEEVLSWQRELGVRYPFICRKGAALHIPRGFFCGLPADGPVDAEWEVIDFGTPRLAHAVRLVATLYRAAGSAPMIVGIGEDWRDRALLHEVDAPIVVRNGAIDQSRLVRNVPAAYVTEAEGPRGWMEAILGHCSAGDA
jgi:predicted mannosyl-3-phosphoglycerate phosphatase (HAD superfamily)